MASNVELYTLVHSKIIPTELNVYRKALSACNIPLEFLHQHQNEQEMITKGTKAAQRTQRTRR